jgi:hypothetical protein
LSVSRASLALVAILLFASCHRPAERFRTPIAAALTVLWNRTEDSPPPQLALNVPPSTALDLSSLQADVAGWQSRLTLFQDTSGCAQAIVPEDSLRALKRVYDVRALTLVEWQAVVARFFSEHHGAPTPADTSPTIHGMVFRVAYQWCRGWPCNGWAWVEVRSTRRGYAPGRTLLWGIE